MTLPPPPREHCLPEHLAGKQYATHQVQIEHTPPGSLGQLAEVRARRQGGIWPVAARRIDKNTDRPPSLHGRVPGACQRFTIHRIGGQENRCAALRFDEPHALGAPLLAATDNSDLRPGAGQSRGHRAAEHARAAQHHSGFPVQAKKICRRGKGRHGCPSGTNSGFRWRA